MSLLVVTGAMTACTFGAAPGTLTASGAGRARSGTPVAVITDIQPFGNVGGFGMCSSLGNPAVASATAAASGTLTPQPCTPVISGPWAPGAPRAAVGGVPALTADSSCVCAYGGTVSVTNPGQVRVQSG